MVDSRDSRAGVIADRRGRLLRTFALILVLLGFVVLGYDAYVFLDRGVFPLTPVGQIWAWINRDSLLLLQPGIERHIHPALWEWFAYLVLERSAAGLLIGLGVAILLLRAWARRRARRREGFTFKRR
jgi:hypothetical protein